MRDAVRLRGVCLLALGLILGLTASVHAADPVAAPMAQPVVSPLPQEGFPSNVQGTVINWGYRNEPDVKVTLSGGGWTLETTTGSDGMFAFSNLGQGVGLLNTVLPEDSGLHPLTTDLAVPFSGAEGWTVNLGIYGGDQYPTGLPVAVRMTASPTEVSPGDLVTYTVAITNSMAGTIHQVHVTDMFPPELSPTDIEISTGSAWIGGQFAAAAIGEMAEGQGEVVTITARLSDDAPADRAVTNRAGVFYAESVALQAEATINQRIISNHLPETGYGTGWPLAAFALVITIVGLRRLRLGELEL